MSVEWWEATDKSQWPSWPSVTVWWTPDCGYLHGRGEDDGSTWPGDVP